MEIISDTRNPLFLRKQESRVSKNLGAVLDNEIYLRWHDEEKPVKLA